MARSDVSTTNKPQEGEVELAAPSPDVLQLLQSAEIDQQVVTAKQYPRDLRTFIKDATYMACDTEDSAQDCMYAIPRDGRVIEGPSARFAEIIASAWGNCQAGARVVDIGREFVTAQGVFWDLQRNARVVYEVRRRITDRNRRRFSEDMIAMTGNAACSIALRNSVLRGVPKPIWAPIYERARETAVGNQQTLSARRQRALDTFAKIGVTKDAVLRKLNRKATDDIDLDDLATLNGLRSAIREGEISIDSAFDLAPQSANQATTSLSDKLAQRAQGDGNGKTKTKRRSADVSDRADAAPVQVESARGGGETLSPVDLPASEQDEANRVMDDQPIQPPDDQTGIRPKAEPTAAARDRTDTRDDPKAEQPNRDTERDSGEPEGEGLSMAEIKMAIANADTGDALNHVNKLILHNTDAGAPERRELRKLHRARANEIANQGSTS